MNDRMKARLKLKGSEPRKMNKVIKHKPEDFIVEEILEKLPKDGEGHMLCILEKQGVDMFGALKTISKVLGIAQKEIGYAGIKDKHAITKQHITIPIKAKHRLSSAEELSSGGDISLRHLKDVEEPIRPGQLQGNRFWITVRSLPKEITLDAPEKVPNFFGEQRFGKCNHAIGEYIVKRDFERAALLAMESQKGGNMIKEHLRKNPKDFVGALGKLRESITIFFIHAYQSFLWNSILEDVLRTKGIEVIAQDDVIPIPGFSSDCPDKFRSSYDKVLKKEGITERDFVIKELPRLSCEGDVREALMNVSEFKHNFDDDEIFKNMKKCKLTFTLGKGSYATSLIEYLFSKM